VASIVVRMAPCKTKQGVMVVGGQISAAELRDCVRDEVKTHLQLSSGVERSQMVDGSLPVHVRRHLVAVLRESEEGGTRDIDIETYRNEPALRSKSAINN